MKAVIQSHKTETIPERYIKVYIRKESYTQSAKKQEFYLKSCKIFRHFYFFW